MGTPILRIDIESKSYQANAERMLVFEGINFEIQRGEFLCIVGPSGCGKTTLLNILAGLDHLYTGQVVFNPASEKSLISPASGAGQNQEDFTKQAVRSCDSNRLLIFQELGLSPWLTVIENIEFGLKLRKIPRKEREKTALEYLTMMNLSRFRDSYIHEISAGMKQRVALARALAMDPEVLLMDEPFSSLDAQTRDLLYAELQRIWDITKKTIIFVTHNVREAVCLGDKILVFSAAPGSRLKARFSVDLPRPRTIESDGVIDIVKSVLVELTSEIKKTYENEINK